MKGKAPVVVSCLALFVALCSTAFAATLITGKDIKDHTITKRDISKSTLKALKGRAGAPGAPGAPGPQGLQGGQGPAGPNWALTPIAASYTIAAGGVDIADAPCPAGLGIVSGGWYTNAAGGAYTDQSFDGRSWSVGVDNFEGATPADVEVYAYCAPLPVSARNARSHGPSRAELIAAQRATHTSR